MLIAAAVLLLVIGLLAIPVELDFRLSTDPTAERRLDQAGRAQVGVHDGVLQFDPHHLEQAVRPGGDAAHGAGGSRGRCTRLSRASITAS